MKIDNEQAQPPIRASRRTAGARRAFVILTALVAASSSPLASRAAPAPPVIEDVVVGDGLLRILGEYHTGPGVDPIVKLEATPLSVQTSSDTEVTALLPAGTRAGKHRLTLRRADGGAAAKVEMPIGIRENVQVTSFAGLIPPIPGAGGLYSFAGPTGSVILTRAGQRLVGAATGPMGLVAGSAPQNGIVGLCYQPAGGGEIKNFLPGANFAVHGFTTSRASYSSTATIGTLPPGTYNVGMCVQSFGPAQITNNNYVNGWVMVVD
jgi:hypothetical protein